MFGACVRRYLARSGAEDGCWQAPWDVCQATVREVDLGETRAAAGDDDVENERTIPIAMRSLIALLAVAGGARAAEPPCDVLIAGGSLASLAAAVSAANASLALSPSSPQSVCLLEITDWLGGQATASGTSAIDLGATWNNFPVNFPATFAAFLTSPPLGPASNNPGGCTVSTKCFLPTLFVAWADALVASLPNLRVYRNTAVVGVARDAADGRVTSLGAVRRTPTAVHPGGWDRLLSAALPDWYSATDSAFFTKEALELPLSATGVVIEATEFGDVLLLGDLDVEQGAERTETTGDVTEQTCGQATTLCFWTQWASTAAPSPDPWPAGSDCGVPFEAPTANSTNATHARLWIDHALTWRRSLAADSSDSAHAREGDIALINQAGLNDVDFVYLFQGVPEARATAAEGAYAGGVDLVALALVEERAYASYHALRGSIAAFMPDAAANFSLNAAAAGTATGLAKMPYLRDTRRAAAGIDKFRLCHDFAAIESPGPGPLGCYNGARRSAAAAAAAAAPLEPGFKFVDSVALGAYGFDIHRLQNSTCVLPAYLQWGGMPAEARPYYVPFRALTHYESPNLLVAGKSMSQSFYANAVTRLHPSEWSTGNAAGAGAALMAHNGWDSLEMFHNVTVLQDMLASDVIGQPLVWNLTA
jgi:hypothetical protein